MLVTIKHLIDQGFITEDDRDDYYTSYVINRNYVIRDSDGNTLFCIQTVKEEGECGTVVLIREADDSDPINIPLGDIFIVTIFKQLEGLNGL